MDSFSFFLVVSLVIIISNIVSGAVLSFFLLKRVELLLSPPPKKSKTKPVQEKKGKPVSIRVKNSKPAVVNAVTDQVIETAAIEIPVIAETVLEYGPGEIKGYDNGVRIFYSAEAIKDPEYLETIRRSPLQTETHEKNTSEFNRDIDGWPSEVWFDETEKRAMLKGYVKGRANVEYVTANKDKAAFGTSAYINFLQLDDVAGIAPNGQPYDAVVRKMVNDHIAILPNPRDPSNRIVAMNCAQVVKNAKKKTIWIVTDKQGRKHEIEFKNNAYEAAQDWHGRENYQKFIEQKEVAADYEVRNAQTAWLNNRTGEKLSEKELNDRLRNLSHEDARDLLKDFVRVKNAKNAKNADDPEQLHKWIKELSAAHPEWEQDQVVAVAYKKIGENATMATNGKEEELIKELYATRDRMTAIGKKDDPEYRRLRKQFDKLVYDINSLDVHKTGLPPNLRNAQEESKNSNDEDKRKMDYDEFKGHMNAYEKEKAEAEEAKNKIKNEIVEELKKEPSDEPKKNADESMNADEPVKEDEKKEAQNARVLPSQEMVKDFSDALGIVFTSTPSFEVLGRYAGIVEKDPAALVGALNAKRLELKSKVTAVNSKTEVGASSVEDVMRSL